MWIKITKWFFLGLVLSVLPFFLNFIAILLHPKTLTGTFSISQLWERGELCLVAATLTATGIGDIASGNMERLKGTKITVLCFSVITLFVSAGMYSQISSCVLLNQPYDTAFARDYTPYLLICSAIAGLACVLLSRETES